VSVQTSQKLDISDLNDEELDILERALQKTIALQDCASPAPASAPRKVRGSGKKLLGAKRHSPSSDTLAGVTRNDHGRGLPSFRGRIKGFELLKRVEIGGRPNCI
jgi:hypothetical protein